MPVYTVHEPPLKSGVASADPERFAFVRDRFTVTAFLFTPVWLVIKRQWLALVLYVLFAGIMMAALKAIGVASGARFAVMALISLLIGLEASSLQRWTLARRKWKQIGTVVADDLESAERRFFAQWSETRVSRADEPVRSSFVSPVINPPRSETLPLGLFPQPGARP